MSAVLRGSGEDRWPAPALLAAPATAEAYDVIGDVHGCLPELLALLNQLGYRVDEALRVRAPRGRHLVFAGDLVDRGVNTPGVLRLVMGAVQDGVASCVLGNHDDQLRRALDGETLPSTRGRAAALDQLARETPAFRAQVRAFLGGLPPRLRLAGGRLLVAHAGDRDTLGEEARSRSNVYGLSLPERDAFGRRLRDDWVAAYRGSALVAYGHTPVRTPQWRGRTVNLDTGCAFGGALSALRFPEGLTASVAARSGVRYGRP
ncbi:metallophosphoesterase [Deinococcus maricopensis]|uniref:Bis(5'-nucleosyl)-tetraphosphatase(Asymmetrical) n=1 Tax=Deinococcus maricopensis (strain DSM 21211 / LMG 22137 / NRRL B-23946 / LB-34) TaxID=709986 RepID=E8UB74_DEIML|nr:metallophosphoesterase [Deinococcus maricopensis]ADV68313.1 Bis(5'-nucleosyl)-tetraphosphatase(asymmetrical) [Deinococcus maricopensis DSM 21211]